ncbi:MAG: hypothetical protein GY714_18260 [Desulfobacterales bacterium]|nr:hypothetical protein [Desulfobacterales bacterium]
MNKMYAELDSRIQKNKETLINFGKSKGMYYTEYVYESLKTKTVKAVRQEMKDFGIVRPPDIETIRSVKFRVERQLETVGNEKKKICMKCNHRVVGDGLHSHCTKCFEDNKKIDSRSDFREAPLRMTHGAYY